MNKDNKQPRLLCVGKIIGAHGIRGEVKIHSYTEEPEMLASYAPITDAAEKRTFKIKIRSVNDDILITSLEGVITRNDAELLRNVPLYVARDILPAIEEDDTFYIEDLKGLKVLHAKTREEYGTVKDVYNYGASDIIAITLSKDGSEEMFAFNHTVFPEINVAAGYVLIDPPEVEFVKDEPVG